MKLKNLKKNFQAAQANRAQAKASRKALEAIIVKLRKELLEQRIVPLHAKGLFWNVKLGEKNLGLMPSNHTYKLRRDERLLIQTNPKDPSVFSLSHQQKGSENSRWQEMSFSNLNVKNMRLDHIQATIEDYAQSVQEHHHKNRFRNYRRLFTKAAFGLGAAILVTGVLSLSPDEGAADRFDVPNSSSVPAFPAEEEDQEIRPAVPTDPTFD